MRPVEVNGADIFDETAGIAARLHPVIKPSQRGQRGFQQGHILRLAELLLDDGRQGEGLVVAERFRVGGGRKTAVLLLREQEVFDGLAPQAGVAVGHFAGQPRVEEPGGLFAPRTINKPVLRADAAAAIADFPDAVEHPVCGFEAIIVTVRISDGSDGGAVDP